MTYSLQLIGGNSVERLGQGNKVLNLAVVDKARAGQQNAGTTGLSLLQQVELGVGNGLGHILLAHSAGSNALQGLDSLLSGLANRGSGTSQLNSQETSIGVGLVG